MLRLSMFREELGSAWVSVISSSRLAERAGRVSSMVEMTT